MTSTVLFFERAIHVCGSAGTVGFIVPNKILSAEYAASLRKIFVRDVEIQSISDYSSIRVFSASVYPVVLVLRLLKTHADAFVEVVQKSPRQAVRQSAFANAPSCLWGFILTDFAEIIETALVDTVELGTRASVLGAATVAEAYELISAIEESDSQEIPSGFNKFVVSGNIRPFRVTWEHAPVQYLKRRYTKPIANLHSIPEKRRDQALKPKVIISGMAKRPVAFEDSKGEYLSGKSTVIIIDPKDDIDLMTITAVLNSKLGSLIYLGLYSGLALSGGYLRFGPPQISAFPIPKDLESMIFHEEAVEDFEAQICRYYSVDFASVESAFARNFGEVGDQDSSLPENGGDEG